MHSPPRISALWRNRRTLLTRFGYSAEVEPSHRSTHRTTRRSITKVAHGRGAAPFELAFVLFAFALSRARRRFRG